MENQVMVYQKWYGVSTVTQILFLKIDMFEENLLYRFFYALRFKITYNYDNIILS